MPSVSALFTQGAEVGAQERSVTFDVFPFTIAALTWSRFVLIMLQSRVVLKVVNLELLS